MSRAAWSEAPPTNISPPRRVRRPAVETIAGWSARHRKTAVFGWLALVAVAYLIGQLLGSPSLQQNDLGQAGQAEQTLQHLGVTTPTTEAVLVQERAPGRTFATDPAMRQAVSQVTAALARVPGAATGISSPLSPGGQALVSANGRSALVTFRVPGPAANVNTAVTPALDAVGQGAGQSPGPAGGRGRRRQPRAGGEQPDKQRPRQGDGDVTAAHPDPARRRVRRAGRRGHPGAARPHLRAHRDLAAGHPRPLAAGRLRDLHRGAARRHGGWHRLLAVLPAPPARRTGARGGAASGDHQRRTHVRPGDRGVGTDRHDGACRAVPDRVRAVHRDGDRGHRRGRHRGHRFADRAARAAVLARGQGRRRAVSRSSAAGARRPRRRCGPPWCAGWSAARCCGAVRPRS